MTEHVPCPEVTCENGSIQVETITGMYDAPRYELTWEPCPRCHGRGHVWPEQLTRAERQDVHAFVGGAL